MEIELKKDKEGSNICTLKNGRDVGASLNLDMLFNQLGSDFSDSEFECILARLGLRHAIMGLDYVHTSENREELADSLSFLENLIDAFRKSISRGSIYQSFLLKEEIYEKDLLGAKKDLKEVQQAFCEARNTIEEYLSKNMLLQNENEALNEMNSCLKQKIKELEKDK